MWNRSQTKRPGADLTSGDLDRAARLLSIRSLREATGLFAGDYVSSFRGSGVEFEESRPYVAGDDVRRIDWTTLARTGEPYVKCFREERNHTLTFALDTSASMGFGSCGRSKASAAAHGLALLAASAARAGDRTGLVAFGPENPLRVPAGRGRAHTWHLIREATRAAAGAGGGGCLGDALRALRAAVPSTRVIFSDFRDPDLDPMARPGRLREALAGLRDRGEVVAGVVVDPLEAELPRVGTLRIEAPNHPSDTWHLDTNSASTRRRYREACAARHRALERELRAGGAEVVWLRSDRPALEALGRFLAARARRRTRVAA